MSIGLVGPTPVKIRRIGETTTLFRIALEEYGDATQWDHIASVNNMTDPWISGYHELKIPGTPTSKLG